jgi:hypothetical protein
MDRYNFRTQLVDYFKKNLRKNYPVQTLKWALINQGYSRTEVQEALDQATKELAEKAPVLKEKPQISYEIFDENDNPIKIKIPWWKRFRLF